MKRKLIIDKFNLLDGDQMKKQVSNTEDITTKLSMAPPTKKLMRLKEKSSVEKILYSPAKPFQTKQGIYRQDGKKFTNPKMSKNPNKKEDFKGNWNEAWRIMKLSQEEIEHEEVKLEPKEVILESKGVKLEPKYINLEPKEPKEVKSKQVRLEHREVRVQSQLQLEFEQFKKKQLMNILPKNNGNFGTEKEDENIENNQLNEAWQIIKQSQEKIEHKEVQVYERFNKKQKKDILPKLSGNFGAEIKAENKENGHPDIDKLGPVLNNKSNIKKSQPNHKFHDDLISKNRKILDNLFRR